MLYVDRIIGENRPDKYSKHFVVLKVRISKRAAVFVERGDLASSISDACEKALSLMGMFTTKNLPEGNIYAPGGVPEFCIGEITEAGFQYDDAEIAQFLKEHPAEEQSWRDRPPLL